jgi:hypothetical protein
MNKFHGLSLAAAILLSGCTSMNKSECLMADWYTIGFEDGNTGKAQSTVGEYRQDCAEHGVKPDLARYREGHQAGSVNFCTTRNGFEQGKRGFSYQGSCSADLEPQFLSGYTEGKHLYDLQSALQRARNAVEFKQQELSKLEKTIKHQTEKLVEDGIAKEERLKLLADLEVLKRDLVETAKELPPLELAVKQAEKALAQAESNTNRYQ